MQDLRLLVFAVRISCAPLVFLQRAVLVQEKKSTSMSEQQHVNLNSTSNEEKVTGGQTGGAG